MKDEGNNNRGDEKTAGGKRQKEKLVSDLRCQAQHVRHSADSFRFEHKMLTDQEKLRIDQDTCRSSKYNNCFAGKCKMLSAQSILLDYLISS